MQPPRLNTSLQSRQTYDTAIAGMLYLSAKANNHCTWSTAAPYVWHNDSIRYSTMRTSIHIYVCSQNLRVILLYSRRQDNVPTIITSSASPNCIIPRSRPHWQSLTSLYRQRVSLYKCPTHKRVRHTAKFKICATRRHTLRLRSYAPYEKRITDWHNARDLHHRVLVSLARTKSELLVPHVAWHFSNVLPNNLQLERYHQLHDARQTRFYRGPPCASSNIVNISASIRIRRRNRPGPANAQHGTHVSNDHHDVKLNDTHHCSKRSFLGLPIAPQPLPRGPASITEKRASPGAAVYKS